MKVLFSIAIFLALLWTGFVMFANMMKSAETGGFVGGNTIAVAWLIVMVLGAVTYWG